MTRSVEAVLEEAGFPAFVCAILLPTTHRPDALHFPATQLVITT